MPSLAPLIRVARPCVVNVDVQRPGEAHDRDRGSGFLISSDGRVVTNAHVVKGATAIRVKLADGRGFPARVVGLDPSTDIALLALALPASSSPLPFARFGDSDSLEVGDWVLVVGNPFGFEHSVAHGMVSAKERVLGVGAFDDYLQTDALINPGNSGGPLFDMRGAVIGVSTAVVKNGQGIGFAVPINLVRDILPNLAVNGRVSRGWLGLTVHQHVGGTVIVEDIYRGSPAVTAGLKPGDKLLRVAGRPVLTYAAALRRIALSAPGSALTLAVQRAGKVIEVRAVLASKPSADVLEVIESVGHLDEVGLFVGLQGSHTPNDVVVVTAVLPGSAAELAGVRAGDAVLSVSQIAVNSVESFVQRARSAWRAGALVLKVRAADGEQRVVTLRSGL